MNKIIIVSNRLPLEFSIANEQLQTRNSVGGLATGLKSVHSSGNSLWMGWTGLSDEQSAPFDAKIDEKLRENNCQAVHLNEKDVEEFYYGFSNDALWPLFHYFTEFARYELGQ